MTVDGYFGKFAELALFRGKSVQGKPRVLEGVPFGFLFGDPKIAALYCISGEEKAATRVFEAEDVREALSVKSKTIPRGALLQHLGGIQPRDQGSSVLTKFIRSLKFLATICQVYESLGDITVAMAVTSKELHASKWMPNTDLSAQNATIFSEESASKLKVWLFQAFEPLELDLASTFACIAMLESGSIDLPKVGLDSIMAISSGDSLFIANTLLLDPSKCPESNFRRIRGNVGRAGIAMLVPPEEPRTRKTEAQDGNRLNHHEFDGHIVDSFKATSLHMSFTEFVLPIDTRTRGLRDIEIYFLETVISVHDKGQWMGDLVVIPVHKSPLLRLVSQSQSCVHEKTMNKQSVPELTSIDSWHEFFDRREEPTVFRAKGNWMARLAATTISVTQGNLTLVFGDRICWECAEDERERLRHKKKPIFVI